jgi:uncharacterized protein YecT (DUF1311 family)
VRPADGIVGPSRPIRRPCGGGIRARRGMMIFAFTALLGGAIASFADASDQPVRIDEFGNPDPAPTPSFNCTKAGNYAERAICSDVSLGWTDRAINDAYLRLMLHAPPHQRGGIQQTQREWVIKRNACSDLGCLRRLSDQREREVQSALDKRDAQLRTPLRAAGDCDDSQIDFIGPRLTATLGAQPDGTSVAFANGVRQVSYDRVLRVLKSRLGDPVRICLVSIPRHCPPGDNRGRVYEVTNLRTRTRWKLPDASHSCGGA